MSILNGNTFPLEAFDTLVKYHEAGGNIVVPSGVPFCHPCVARGAVGWSFGYGTTSGGRTLGEARTGKESFEVYNAAGRDWTGPNSARFPVRPGERYVVGGWVKHDAEFSPHPNTCIFLRFFDGEGRFIGQEGPRIPDEPCEWVRVQKEVVVPEGAATADVSQQLWTTKAHLFLDDVFLLRADKGENLLPNPSFEEGRGAFTDFQGLINRERPRLYIIHTRYDAQDQQWLEELNFEGLNAQDVTHGEAGLKIGDVTEEYMAYDKAVLQEIGAFRAERLNVTNAVLMLRAVNEAVPLALGTDEAPLDDKPVLFDTRGRWKTPVELYGFPPARSFPIWMLVLSKDPGRRRDASSCPEEA